MIVCAIVGLILFFFGLLCKAINWNLGGIEILCVFVGYMVANIPIISELSKSDGPWFTGGGL